ncbi:MAG: hypothetical protein ALECFALPRED_001191 [Alectoria fallacina]|uniref:Sphingoid long-chain base transporter RSB1 n=1 Tax=Alectoria fallacina TaxID=1903189 RepID=A0A8H3JAN7_9LECA|nr:MAG: hypothetical protein ALECFALPRED_001191 [Alectoria fallacina]
MSNDTYPLTNSTLYNEPWLCTVQTCPLSWAQVQYDPSLAGNAFYLAMFSLVLVVQLFFGIRYRTWSFLGAIFGGEVLEMIGYIARVQMHYNPFLSNPFLMYLIVLTIAPCFLSAGIYLCFSRIVVLYGEKFARFKPRTYTIIFITADVFSLVLQAAGGALADTSPGGNSSQGQDGINIMIAGLSFQVVSLFIFMSLCADFAVQVKRYGADAREGLRRCGCGVGRFHGFLIALVIATLTIFIRSCFRVAELHGGFNGKLANDQVSFMILEGAMVVIASVALTVWHPGLVFGGFWNLNRARVTMRGESEVVAGGKNGVLLTETGVV